MAGSNDDYSDNGSVPLNDRQCKVSLPSAGSAMPAVTEDALPKLSVSHHVPFPSKLAALVGRATTLLHAQRQQRHPCALCAVPQAASPCWKLHGADRHTLSFPTSAGGRVRIPARAREGVLQTGALLLVPCTAAAGDEHAPASTDTASSGRHRSHIIGFATDAHIWAPGPGRRGGAPLLPAVWRLPRSVRLSGPSQVTACPCQSETQRTL